MRRKQIGLSKRQVEILEYITKQTALRGYPPSVREIGEAVGLQSSSTVHSHLTQLEEKGYIRREKGKSRSMRVDEHGGSLDGGRTAKVPIVGKVTAGVPVLAVENYEGYLDFPIMNKGLYGQLFALRISGTSMIGAGIMDGDVVVVNKCTHAENGDIVVALLEDEATVKRFFKEEGRFRLQPENPALEPIYTDEVYILGKVVAVLRYYY